MEFNFTFFLKMMKLSKILNKLNSSKKKLLSKKTPKDKPNPSDKEFNSFLKNKKNTSPPLFLDTTFLKSKKESTESYNNPNTPFNNTEEPKETKFTNPINLSTLNLSDNPMSKLPLLIPLTLDPNNNNTMEVTNPLILPTTTELINLTNNPTITPSLPLLTTTPLKTNKMTTIFLYPPELLNKKSKLVKTNLMFPPSTNKPQNSNNKANNNNKI